MTDIAEAQAVRLRRRLAGVWVGLAVCSAMPAAADDWLCTATTGTAYELRRENASWATVMFAVDERYRIRRSAGAVARWFAIRAGAAAEPLACSIQDADGPVLQCGERLRVHLGQGWFSVSLPDTDGGGDAERVASTAAGFCRPAGGQDGSPF